MVFSHLSYWYFSWKKKKEKPRKRCVRPWTNDVPSTNRSPQWNEKTNNYTEIVLNFKLKSRIWNETPEIDRCRNWRKSTRCWRPELRRWLRRRDRWVFFLFLREMNKKIGFHGYFYLYLHFVVRYGALDAVFGCLHRNETTVTQNF